MNVRSIIALFLGLVIQFSLVQSSLATGSAKSCGGESMTCCDGLQSCPCAREGDPDQKPSPMTPAAVDTKLLVSKTTESVRIEMPICPSTGGSHSAVACADFIKGYAGVPLAVAFCRFVI